MPDGWGTQRLKPRLSLRQLRKYCGAKVRAVNWNQPNTVCKHLMLLARESSCHGLSSLELEILRLGVSVIDIFKMSRASWVFGFMGQVCGANFKPAFDFLRGSVSPTREP